MSKTISDFSDVLKKIIETGGGKDTLRDKRKTKNLLNDLAPGDNFSGQKKLLDDAYSCNAVGILLDADSSADRHQKAVEAAREKLKNNFTAESGINIILKDICDALGWNTQKLFEDNSAKQQETSSPNRPVFVMDSSEHEVKPVNYERDSERDNHRQEYSQPFSHPEPVHRNTEVNTQSQSIPIVPAQKKKSPFMTVLKIAAVLIVIGVIYNLGKGSNNNENIVVDETQNAVVADTSETTQTETTTEAMTVAENVTSAIVEEAITETTTAEPFTEAVTEKTDAAEIIAATSEAVVAVTEPSAAITTVPTTTTQATTTTTADPNAGKYVITDIAKLGYTKSNFYSDLITYVDETNTVYYVEDSGDLHEYDLASNSDKIVLTAEDAINTVTENSANSLVNNKYSSVNVNGVTYNSYNKKIYMFGDGHISGYPCSWIYEVGTGAYAWSQGNVTFRAVHFFSEKEYIVSRFSQGWGVGDIREGTIKICDTAYRIFDTFEVDGYFYGYNYTYGQLEFVGIENIYMENSAYRLFFKKTAAYGINVKDNKVYYKDSENNILIFNMNYLTEEEYISSDMIVQNGRSFLSEDSCMGLYITNDGGFITYDTADGKIKYVSKN